MIGKSSCWKRMDQMPTVRDLGQKLCRRSGCRNKARLRCSACWTWYCSNICQRRNWRSHVFTCTTPNRPNNADYLRLIVRRVKKGMESGSLEHVHDSLLKIFADDHICRIFGFSKTASWKEAVLLVCLYDTIISTCRKPIGAIQKALEVGSLGHFLKTYCQQRVEQAGGQSECDCITWYLTSRAEELFLEPSDRRSHVQHLGYRMRRGNGTSGVDPSNWRWTEVQRPPVRGSQDLRRHPAASLAASQRLLLRLDQLWILLLQILLATPGACKQVRGFGFLRGHL
ncbi:hypothetical protein GE09DRAFT_744219 [Coniochaeta sp. 2T2.1]|nr:hypothetical protein GE09DRAFT_744219 [Coniochaeta sp. 2T2.1]